MLMKAVVIDGYGGSDRLQTREVARPEPGPGEVLIRVRAAGVNPLDWKIRRGEMRPLVPRRLPFIPGADVAGEVEANGSGASRFASGDAVYALCGVAGGGGYAQYVAVEEAQVASKPDAWSFEEAAAVPTAGLTALQAFRDLGGLQAGGSALVNGGAGGVGHFAVQIGRALGARVAATCGPENVDFVRGLGADTVFDYNKTDFTRGPGTYDVVLDAVAKSSFPACRMILAVAGHYVTTLPSPGTFFWSAAQAVPRFGPRQRAHFIVVKASGPDLESLARLAADGRLRPTIACVFSLDQARQAHDASEAGHTRGKLVLRVD